MRQLVRAPVQALVLAFCEGGAAPPGRTALGGGVAAAAGPGAAPEAGRARAPGDGAAEAPRAPRVRKQDSALPAPAEGNRGRGSTRTRALAREPEETPGHDERVWQRNYSAAYLAA